LSISRFIQYFSYPFLIACNCSTCDEFTGNCRCPPGVIGENCDRCKPGTFGYDPVIGCQPCNCDSTGTGNPDAYCDIQTGQCPCLENYGSRKCSQCAAGYYNYPVCTKCDCFAGGVSGAKCDAKTGECICQVMIEFRISGYLLLLLLLFRNYSKIPLSFDYSIIG